MKRIFGLVSVLLVLGLVGCTQMPKDTPQSVPAAIVDMYVPIAATTVASAGKVAIYCKGNPGNDGPKFMVGNALPVGWKPYDAKTNGSYNFPQPDKWAGPYVYSADDWGVPGYVTAVKLMKNVLDNNWGGEDSYSLSGWTALLKSSTSGFNLNVNGAQLEIRKSSTFNNAISIIFDFDLKIVAVFVQ